MSLPKELRKELPQVMQKPPWEPIGRGIAVRHLGKVIIKLLQVRS
jgi:hypothetical protein